MKRHILLLAFIIPVLITAKIITLDEAVAIALTRSLELEQELNSYQDQVSGNKTTMYEWLPTSSISMGKDLQDGKWNDMSADFSFSWNIYSNDERYYGMRSQILSMQIAEMSFENKQKEIAKSVLEKYITILQSEESLQLEIERMEANKLEFEKQQFRLELGEIDQIELDETEVNYIQSDIDVSLKQANLENARRDFFFYINRDDEGEELSPVKLDIESTKKPFQANLSYRIEQLNLEKTELRRKQSYMDLFPVLALGYNYSKPLDNGFNDDDSHTVSLGLSYSFFSLLTKLEDYKMLKKDLDLSRLELDANEQENRNTYTLLTSELERLNRNYELFGRKSELALRILERAQIEYEQGTISMLELTDKQNSYYQARKDEIDSYYSAIKMQEELNLLLSEKVLGKW